MEPTFIHPSAIIDEGVTIGAGCKIWHFCHLMGPSELGEKCSLGQNVFVGEKVKLGRNVRVQNNVSLFTGVVCEDDVFIGPSVVFTNVINPRSSINRRAEFKPTLVKKGASLGANATIVCGLEIGEYAFVGAGSVVTKSVPDYALVYGNPAKQRGWVSRAGHTLKFDDSGLALCPETGEKYRLSNSGLALIPAYFRK